MQTVIGAFDDSAAAARAVAALKGAGFPDSSVTTQARPAATPSTSPSGTAEEEGFLGSVGHFFSNLFGSDDEERTGHYSEAVKRGHSVVTVDVMTDDEMETAGSILDSHGAIDVDERATQWKAEGLTGAATQSTGAAWAQPRTPLSTDGTQTLNVVQEELAVGKRTVRKGGVRVVQRVTETPVSESVNLREEHASIERRPVDRVATSADLTSLKDMSIEVRETAEEAVVSKTARVVEEVVVGKEASEHVQNVSDTVRRTDVEVERFDSPTTTTSTGSLPKGDGSVKDGYGDLQDGLKD